MTLNDDVHSCDKINIDFEEVVKDLKEKGFNQIETVKYLMKNYNMKLKRADKLVLYSSAWSDHLNANAKVRNEFFNVVIRHNDESDKSDV